MRLRVLDHGHGPATKLLFAVIRAASRQPIPEILKLMKYRADYFGRPMQTLTQRVMRGPSPWSVAERELMAAVVSQANASEYCTKAHSAVATRAYQNAGMVAAVLSDVETAPIAEPLRATLRMLRSLTRTGTVGADDMRALRAAGATREQIEDALAVAFVFNVINRLADAFGFDVPGPQAFEAGAKFLLARGYG